MDMVQKSRQQLDAERRQRLSQLPRHPGDPKNVHRPKYVLGASAKDCKEHFESKGNRRRFSEKYYEKLLKQACNEGDQPLKTENVLGETFYYGMKCFHCGSHNIVKAGKRKPKRLNNSVTQLYRCNDCGRICSRRQLSEEIDYHEKIRVLFENGVPVKEIVSALKEIDGYEVSESTVYRWMRELEQKRIVHFNANEN